MGGPGWLAMILPDFYINRGLQRFADVFEGDFRWSHRTSKEQELTTTLQDTNIFHLGKRKIIFKNRLGMGYVSSLEGNLWIPLDLNRNFPRKCSKIDTMAMADFEWSDRQFKSSCKNQEKMSEQLERISSTLEAEAIDSGSGGSSSDSAAAVPAGTTWVAHNSRKNPCGVQWSNQLDWENKMSKHRWEPQKLPQVESCFKCQDSSE